MSKTKFKTAAAIPTAQRGPRGSRYSEVLEAAEEAAPKAILAFEMETAGKAANRASYIREVDTHNRFEVAQRDKEVWVRLLTEEESKEMVARRKATARKRAKTRAKRSA